MRFYYTSEQQILKGYRQMKTSTNQNIDKLEHRLIKKRVCNNTISSNINVQ